MELNPRGYRMKLIHYPVKTDLERLAVSVLLAEYDEVEDVLLRVSKLDGKQIVELSEIIKTIKTNVGMGEA